MHFLKFFNFCSVHHLFPFCSILQINELLVNINTILAVCLFLWRFNSQFECTFKRLFSGQGVPKGTIAGHCFVSLMMIAVFFVSIYKPYSFPLLDSGDPNQRILLVNYFGCLTDNLTVLVILYTIDTILAMLFELITLAAVVYSASICLCAAHILGQTSRQLVTLEDCKELKIEKALEKWKIKYVQMVKIIEDVDSSVSPHSCYTICVFTYGVLAALYAVIMFCNETNLVYSVKVVMKALLPLGSLMICAVTVDFQVQIQFLVAWLTIEIILN